MVHYLEKPRGGGVLNTNILVWDEERMDLFSLSSPIKNKGFINYTLCRNWAVRLSSLVNKQVMGGHDSVG